MSTFEHLAYAVGRHYDEALFVMMTCYFDESFEWWVEGDDKSHGFTFVCGYVASVEQWKAFEVEWRQYLDGYGVADFHLTDYCSNSGEFKKWKADEFAPIRAKFMQDASAIVRKFVRYGFVAAISDSVFRLVNESYMVEESFRSPYGLVGRECANLAWLRRTKFYPKESDLDFVFEDGGPDKCGLMKAMTQLRPAFPDPIFKPGKNQKPSQKYPDGRKAVLQLQAADYLAYEVRKLFADQIRVTPVRGVRLSFKALTSIPTAKKLFTADELKATCQRMKIDRRK